MKRLAVVWIVVLAVALVASGVVMAQDGASVSVEPATRKVEVGQPAVVEILVEDVVNLYGAEVHLVFDPAVLQVDALASGPLLDEAQGAVVQDFDNTAGTVDYAISLLAPASPVDGAGVLLVVTFDTRAAGASAISITEAILANAQGEQMPASTSDSEIVVTAPPDDIPEAGTLALLGSGLAGLAAFMRRKRAA